MKYSFFTFLLLINYVLNAQRTIDVSKTDNTPVGNFYYTVNGVPFSTAKYIKVVEGSAFFSDGWMNGQVFYNDGTGYKDLLLKIDLLENEIHFLSSAGDEMIVSTPLKEVILTDSITNISYRFMNSDFISKNGDLHKNQWYQSLEAGTTSLYKQIKKGISESQPYGAATYEQKISTTPVYIISTPAKNILIKKWKDLPDAFAEKKPLIEKFITDNKLNGKSDADYINVLHYYNSL
ncbi:MAG TPA: hypothetical protein VIQ00_09825 [Chitinophagaceae bacterium]